MIGDPHHDQYDDRILQDPERNHGSHSTWLLFYHQDLLWILEADFVHRIHHLKTRFRSCDLYPKPVRSQACFRFHAVERHSRNRYALGEGAVLRRL